ncbi:MAG TPA: polysaccharide biosynthesis/export family protein [Gemmatimonadales bacterium]|jgi:polysaccharide export outer membrane protein
MRNSILGYIALPLLVGVTGVSAQSPSTTTRPPEQTVLSPGDTLRITVWRKPEFSGEFVIGADGTLIHPLFRAVRVAGVPLATAEANIRNFLLQYDQNPQFVIEPLLRIAVSGEVPKPSVFAVQPRTTIAEAIARAGGTTQNGNRKKVRVIRSESGSEQRVFLANLQDPADPIASSIVRSGDQVVVDRRRSFFRDILIPTFTVIGSIASIGLLIDRIQRNN